MLLLAHRGVRHSRACMWGVSRRTLQNGDRMAMRTGLSKLVTVIGLKSLRLRVADALMLVILLGVLLRGHLMFRCGKSWLRLLRRLSWL